MSQHISRFVWTRNVRAQFIRASWVQSAVMLCIYSFCSAREGVQIWVSSVQQSVTLQYAEVWFHRLRWSTATCRLSTSAVFWWRAVASSYAQYCWTSRCFCANAVFVIVPSYSEPLQYNFHHSSAVPKGIRQFCRRARLSWCKNLTTTASAVGDCQALGGPRGTYEGMLISPQPDLHPDVVGRNR